MTVFIAVTKVILVSTATRARLISLSLLGLVAVAVGFAIGLADPYSPAQASTDLVNAYGLTILAPIVALVLASATLGDTVEDDTLVYLTLRPVQRWVIATAAIVAAAGAAVPVVAIPLVVAALLAGGGIQVAFGAALASALAVVAYSGLFVAIGLFVKRSLLWGIVYILIWEGFIARTGTSASRWSIQYYARSALSDISDVWLRLGDAPMAAALLVPIGVAVAGVALTTARLRRMSIA